MNLKDLVGKTITEIEISECKQYIKFNTHTEDIIWSLYNDCCSDGWIEHMSIPYIKDNLLIEEVNEIDLGEVMPTIQEVDKLYGVKIRCINKNGIPREINIEFRNSSNGYYGSFLEHNLAKDLKLSDVNFKKVTESF